MKYLLLFFIATNIYAQHFANIIPNDAGEAKMQLDCNADSTCNSVLVEWIARQDHYKVNWNETSENSIASKVEIQNEVEVTKYAVPINFLIVKVDKTAEISNAALELAIEKKVACGDSTVKYIAKRNVQKGLTTAQIRLVAQTYSQIFDLLKAGAIDTAKEDIQNASIDGIIITEADKTAILTFINECQ